MTNQLEITNDERIRILRELATNKCFCGARKAMSQTFCRPHYSSLPGQMRSMLYQRSGHGYEEAYTAAREYLVNVKAA
jgi:hypothetical protein